VTYSDELSFQRLERLEHQKTASWTSLLTRNIDLPNLEGAVKDAKLWGANRDSFGLDLGQLPCARIGTITTCSTINV
jgi:hypothetical protein